MVLIHLSVNLLFQEANFLQGLALKCQLRSKGFTVASKNKSFPQIHAGVVALK